MTRLAANVSLMFAELDFLDRFAAARANGFEAVELLFPYTWPAAEIAARLAKSQLQLVLHNLPAGDWAAGDRGLACNPARVDEFRSGISQALDYAGVLGVRQLHCLAGIVPPGVAPAVAHATYVANLHHAAQRLKQQGMHLLIEPINTWDMPGYFLTASAQAADIIAECAADNIFMQYDIYHMQRMEGNLADTIRANFALIKHIQLADVPGRHEPGTGDIDFAHLFTLLDELGYDGWIGCEYHPLGQTVAGLDWRTRL